MDPSSAQLHQEMATDQTLEGMLVCSKTQQEKKPRPQPEEALKCPRCDSTNTKFCYYNNYSLTQPRYFCKSCRRYWTKGGTLRNVPVGGGCRRNKRSPSSSSSSSKRSQDQPLITNNLHSPDLSPLPGLTYDPNDLSLAFARLQKQPTGQLGFDDHHHDLNSMGVFGYPNVQTMISAPNGFHNLYYGMGNGNMGHVENGGLSINASEEMAMPYEETSMAVTAMKQEFCNGGREGENRVSWGFPWQLGGDGNMGDLDSSGRESWNGSIGSSWHGLLNSPLT